MSRRNWKQIRPTSLRQALELCKDHGRERKNLSVERIAVEMGITDHWTLYKWFQTGRIPANLIRPFEVATGIDYVTRWLAASAGKLVIDIPTGRDIKPNDMQALQELINTAVGTLLQFYDGRAKAPDTLAAIQTAMEAMAWHHGNVGKHLQPELELGVPNE